jgi:hypothetical protein
LPPDHEDFSFSGSIAERKTVEKTGWSNGYVTSSAFVELDLKASLPEAECLVEMEDKAGAKREMHIKGRLCVDPLELMKAFLGQGR